MTITNPRQRRWGTIGARTGFVVSAVALALSVNSAFSSQPPAGAAATAGTAQVIVPMGEDQVDGGKLLDSGDSSTDFSLLLPDGAACTGDSAAQDYRIYSYFVGGEIDPTSLEFLGSAGPQPEAFGAPLAEFRQPLYDVFGSPFNAAQTANAEDDDGPGLIVNIPAFSLAVFEEATNLPLGEYNAGIACWGPGADPGLDKFWNVRFTVEANANDAGPVGISWTAEQSAASSTTVELEVDPAGQAEEGEEVVMTATLTPADASGEVTFTAGEDEVGTAAVDQGVATLVVDDLPVGQHVLAAAFSPAAGGDHLASTSPEMTYEIVASGTGTTTTTTVEGATTSTTPSTTAPGSSAPTTALAVSGGGSGGPSTGSPLTSLPLTGASMSMGVWGLLLVVFGRMAVLLGRTPAVLPSSQT